MSLYIRINNSIFNFKNKFNNTREINSLSHFSHFGQASLIMLVI
jgi:hypothetical protein